MIPSDTRRRYESDNDERRYEVDEPDDNRRLREWASLTGEKLPEELGACGSGRGRED